MTVKEEILIRCIQEEHPDFDPLDMEKEEYQDLISPILRAMDEYRDSYIPLPKTEEL